MGGNGAKLSSSSTSITNNSTNEFNQIRASEAISEMSYRASRMVNRIQDDVDGREVLQEYDRRIRTLENEGLSTRNSFRQSVIIQELVQLKAERQAIRNYIDDYII